MRPSSRHVSRVAFKNCAGRIRLVIVVHRSQGFLRTWNVPKPKRSSCCTVALQLCLRFPSHHFKPRFINFADMNFSSDGSFFRKSVYIVSKEKRKRSRHSTKRKKLIVSSPSAQRPIRIDNLILYRFWPDYQPFYCVFVSRRREEALHDSWRNVAWLDIHTEVSLSLRLN